MYQPRYNEKKKNDASMRDSEIIRIHMAPRGFGIFFDKAKRVSGVSGDAKRSTGMGH